MFILAIAAQKGGVGKTTLAMNLAIVAAFDGLPTVVFDLDPQASASSWHDRRIENTGQDQPKVIATPAKRLPQALKAAQNDGYELAIIDTPPNVGGEAVHICRAADLILVPSQPSALDLDAIQASLDIIKIAERPAAVVLNKTKPTGALTVDARVLIETAYDFETYPSQVGDRVAFVHAAIEGKGVVETDPESKASVETVLLWKWTKKRLKAIERNETAIERIA